MPPKVRWGVLGVAKIATTKVIPAMQRGEYCEVVAIASRDERKASEAAAQLGIPKAYGSYEQLLADPGIDAIYNPLPNHLHVPWSIRCAEAGRHVLHDGFPLKMLVPGIGDAAARDLTGCEWAIELHAKPLAKLTVAGQRTPDPRDGRVEFDALLDTTVHFTEPPVGILPEPCW